MLNLITVGITMKLKVLLIVMSYSFLEPPVSTKVKWTKQTFHAFYVKGLARLFKKLLRIKY